jgi:hypothetical protein
LKNTGFLQNGLTDKSSISTGKQGIFIKKQYLSKNKCSPDAMGYLNIALELDVLLRVCCE